MQELFLTSSVHAVAGDISKRVDLSKNRLVFITTAADFKEGDKEWLRRDRQSLVDAGFEVTDYTIVEKTKSQLESDLKDFDVIYLSGGNTMYLLQQSQKSGFITVIREFVTEKGKIYIGTSAGSIIAGPTVPSYLEDENENIAIEGNVGYGFVNFTMVPHWGSDHFRERYLDRRLEAAYKEDQVPLILLTDNQFVHVQGTRCEIVDTTKKQVSM